MDEILILKALLTAGLTSAGVLLLCGWPWRKPLRILASAGSVVGVGLGFYLACWMLGLLPKWPPLEDNDRFQILLFPTLLGIEFLACFSVRWRALWWVPRLLIAAAAARVLLHGSTFIQAPDELTPAEWTPAQGWAILAGLAGALAFVWAILGLLALRASSKSVPLAVAVVLGGASVTVMLSGYATGGEPGLALSAALVGAVVGSCVVRGKQDFTGIVGLGVVSLFAILVVGRFFGALTTLNGTLLFLGLLLAWVPELPVLRRSLGAWWGGLLRVILVAVPVVVALFLANEKNGKDAPAEVPAASQPTVDDYNSFHK